MTTITPNIQESIIKQFPILNTEVRGRKLVYFDNGATTQKPQRVIDSLTRYYQHENSNIHRGVHCLSQRATEKFEATRKSVKVFLGAKQEHEIIFTRGTTEGINLVAQCFGKQYIKSGDEVIISAMEHHSNIVPWQMMSEERGAVLKTIPFHPNGELDMNTYHNLLSDKTKLVAVTHVSNTLGTINPAREIISKAHQVGAKVLLDGAQAVAHMPIDVVDLDVDFYVFSSHKLFGPTGVGVLYGKENLLEAMPPYQGGGDMIKTVTLEKTTYNDLPHKFEAGTPHISGVIGLNEAISFVNEIGFETIYNLEESLLQHGISELSKIDGVEFFGTARHKASLISFNLKGAHPFDVGTILDQLSIAVRTGHHCTQPIMDYYQIPGTVRASFALYNTTEEIDKLAEGLRKASRMLL
ncbi:MAG: aminotransferase class V-fold PLP-dependent enzyme [Flavobacteriales bacterium]